MQSFKSYYQRWDSKPVPPQTMEIKNTKFLLQKAFSGLQL